MLISTVLITWGLTAWLLPQSPEMPASPGAEIKLPNRENAVSDQWSFSLMAAFLVTALLVAPSVMSQNQPEKSGSVDAPSPEALAHLKSGTALATDNQYDPAIREFQKVVELDPENAQAYTFWGNCLNDEGKYGEAIPLFRKASEIVPQEAVIYVYWGASLKGLGRTDEALLMFQRAIQTEPLNGVITQTANDEIAKMKETKGPGL
jgi:tetratricopeptide (TPR) repeat protein